MNKVGLLKHAVPLVKTYGFTRTTLAYSLPEAKPGSTPLDDTAVTALFGYGNAARVTLIRAWMDQGLEEMRKVADVQIEADSQRVVERALLTRLQWNEHAHPYLPEAFALLTSPELPAPPLDPRPLIAHAANIADKACYVAQDTSVGTEWYARRAALASAYCAAELHQLTSPATANAFLIELLETASQVEKATNNTSQFIEFVLRSWQGIFKSLGSF